MDTAPTAPPAAARQADLLRAEGWITCREAATRLGRHITTVYRMIDQGVAGKRAAGMQVGRARYVRAASLVALLGDEGAVLLGLREPEPPGPRPADDSDIPF